MKGFGAQGIAILLLAATALTLSAETAVSQNSGAASPTTVEVSELQRALQESRAEAEFIQNRNRKLAERRQSLEKRIADLHEQLLRQEQSMEPVDSSTLKAPGPDEQRGEAVSDEETAAAPQAQK
jgi:predicted transcriptional regulator